MIIPSYTRHNRARTHTQIYLNTEYRVPVTVHELKPLRGCVSFPEATAESSATRFNDQAIFCPPAKAAKKKVLVYTPAVMSGTLNHRCLYKERSVRHCSTASDKAWKGQRMPPFYIGIS